ncbi:hypothetical protein RvY_03854 [Ramazzottius varieornatus]|uniref:Uncharacterized protein n=1 Tax=Ramazzottius varieornatus TaxID=947166 RepID=A0A1D1UYV1_RAMVA|nr:hypothetical protein RvY_03854 [Ramazzottius varieornatus]
MYRKLTSKDTTTSIGVSSTKDVSPISRSHGITVAKRAGSEGTGVGVSPVVGRNIPKHGRSSTDSVSVGYGVTTEAISHRDETSSVHVSLAPTLLDDALLTSVVLEALATLCLTTRLCCATGG